MAVQYETYETYDTMEKTYDTMETVEARTFKQALFFWALSLTPNVDFLSMI